jgi:hypothetical protein
MSDQSDLLIEKIKLFFPVKLREKYVGIVLAEVTEKKRLRALLGEALEHIGESSGWFTSTARGAQWKKDAQEALK